MKKEELPRSSGFALEELEIMSRFSSLAESEQARILRMARRAETEQEMQALIDRLSAQ